MLKTIIYKGECAYVPISAHLVHITHHELRTRQQVAKVRQGDKLRVLAETELNGDKFYYVNGLYQEQRGWVEAWYFEEE